MSATNHGATTLALTVRCCQEYKPGLALDCNGASDEPAAY